MHGLLNMDGLLVPLFLILFNIPSQLKPRRSFSSGGELTPDGATIIPGVRENCCSFGMLHSIRKGRIVSGLRTLTIFENRYYYYCESNAFYRV